MFKPVRILQIATIFTLLAGCATSQTTAVSAVTAPATASAPRGTTSAPQAKPEPPSIKAGKSVNNDQGFLTTDGRLRPDLRAYAAEVSKTRGVPLTYVHHTLKSAHYNATVARLMTPSTTRIRRSWVTYRKRFVEPVRIRTGVQFWTEHRAALDRTTKQYGVAPSIIVAILGVETVYGRQTGDFRVLDALATLGFRNPDPARPERSQLFRDQLADLIQLGYQKQLDPLQVKGSFAGAIGLPQFMPGSLMRFAVDGDHDGRIDLRGNADDAIASVAHFLRLHGWQPGVPVFAPVILPDDPADLVDGGLYPSYDWEQLKARGARTRPGAANTAWQHFRVGVVDLLDEPRKLAEYRTGTPNFFAITHYNRSYFYAASVADLAQELAERMGYGDPNLIENAGR